MELSALFYSPIAWFLLILFHIQLGMAYVDKLDYAVTDQELGRLLGNLTFNFFANPQQGGLLISTVLSNLYLYIPLITMGLISRETHSGTIKLLYSSPVKLSSIVLGKYVAMLIFNLCMIMVIMISVVFASFHIESLDAGLIFSGLLGVYLLLSAYAAIGLFMSCLSTYQVVAAIATFAVFALLKFVGGLWQDYDFFRDLTSYLSISGRTETMVFGLITTKDVLYYVLITAMFLTFAWLKLKGERDSDSWMKSALRYSMVLAVVLVVGYVSSMPGFVGYWDTTRTRMNTISEKAQQVIKDLGDEPLTVTTYVNFLDDTYFYGQRRSRNADKRRWEEYIRFKKDIRLNYVNYYDSTRNEYIYKTNPGKTLEQIAKDRAKAFKVDLDWFIKPAEIRKMINLVPEKNRLVMLLEYKGKKTFLRVFDDLDVYPSEIEIVAALKRLTVPLPRIAFLQGEEERSIDKSGDRHYKMATSEVNTRAALINQGFDVLSLSLKEQDIPKGLTALVIADPRAEFDPVVLKKIEQYIDGGGNLLLAGEPGKQSVLNPILKRLGVQLMDGTIVQGNKSLAPDEVKSYVSAVGDEFGSRIISMYNRKTPVNTYGAAGLTFVNNGDFKIRTLLSTDGKSSWNKTGKLVLDSADVIFNPKAGDEMKALPTAIYLTRNIDAKEQRILVTGDADFLSNIELSRKVYPETANGKFYQGLLGWFTYGKFPIETNRASTTDNSLNVTSDGVKGIKLVILFVIPAVLLLAGAILLIRRKRK